MCNDFIDEMISAADFASDALQRMRGQCLNEQDAVNWQYVQDQARKCVDKFMSLAVHAGENHERYGGDRTV